MHTKFNLEHLGQHEQNTPASGCTRSFAPQGLLVWPEIAVLSRLGAETQGSHGCTCLPG